MSYEVPERAVDRIAAEWNRVFAPVEEPPTEPVEEPEPVGHGNVIPSAGHQPELTDERVKAITRSGKTNHELLAELLEQQRQGYTWYGGK